MPLANVVGHTRTLLASPHLPAQGRMLGLTLLAIAPMFLASVVMPARGVAIVVLASSWAMVYQLTSLYQAQLFTLPLRPTHFIVAVPLTAFIVLWAFLVLLIDRRDQLGATIFPALLLILTAIAPLYRRQKSERQQRVLPYLFLYSSAAAIVFVIEILILWGLS